MRFLHREIPDRSRLRPTVPLSVFCAAAMLAFVPSSVSAQPVIPFTVPTVDSVVVTSLRGSVAVFSEGSDSGIAPGSIFTISRGGMVRAKLRVTEVSAGQSTATLFDVQENYLVTVGEIARYYTYEAPVVATPTPAPTPAPTPIPQATPDIPLSSSENGATPTPTPVTSSTGNGTETPLPIDALAGFIEARIINIKDKIVTLDVGLQSGIRTGVNVPVWRNGSVGAILRVQSSSSYESTALITWQDDALQALAVGDTVRVEGSGPANSTTSTNETLVRDGKIVPPTPAAPIRFETGASNIVVPRADRAYELLASLATSGLILSQSPDVFQDDGILRHRTENDINFTRAQIGEFVREAIENSDNGEKLSSRQRTTLGLLVRDYSPELAILRVEPERIAKLSANKGFSLGYSGQLRASYVSGKDNFALPFSEPQGDIRLKSGADLRLNVFGNINKRLSFFSTIDATSKLDRNSDNSNVSLRRVVLSYDASNIARGLTIDVGKNEYWFGPGHYGTMLLSDNAGGLNSIHTNFKRGAFQYDGVYALLGRGPDGGNRALYSRNFQYKIGSQARIGFAESLLTPKNSFDAISAAASLIPIPLPLSALQRLRGKNGIGNGNNTNSLYEVYGEVGVARGMQIYGEFLLDDIATSSNNLTRNRLGTLIGAHIFTPSDPTKLGLYAEYTTLSGRTYFAQIYTFDQDFDYNYFQKGDSLGYPNTANPGNFGRGGADSFRFTLYGKVGNRLRLSGGFEYTDKNSEEPFTGRQQIFRFRAAYNLSKNLTLYGRYLKVDQGVGSSVIGPVTPGTPATVQTKQSRFEVGLAQSF